MKNEALFAGSELQESCDLYEPIRAEYLGWPAGPINWLHLLRPFIGSEDIA